MNADSVMFSSETDMWATPQWLFDRLNREFHFGTDVCALPENAKCPTFYTPADDGLKQTWRCACWMNPPYGRGIGEWVKKAYQSTQMYGATVVCLLPARTDTTWWWRYCINGEIRFFRGRIRFGDATTGAPFPSAVVIFAPDIAAKVVWVAEQPYTLPLFEGESAS
jgi:phage N-6-adenine-methyltransferase